MLEGIGPKNYELAVVLRGVFKTYCVSKKERHALKDVTLEIPQGKCCVLTGPSGSGKTTLLNIAALLTRPSKGRVVLFGKDTTRIGEYGLDRLRRQEIGVIFQSLNLLGALSVIDNVTLPLVPHGIGLKIRTRIGLKVLENLGLGEFAAMRAEQLSGGQQQRVAIARALIGQPSLIIADEPTSNLDEESVEAIVKSLAMLKAEGKTLLISSHDPRVVDGELGDTQLQLQSGAIRELFQRGGS